MTWLRFPPIGLPILLTSCLLAFGCAGPSAMENTSAPEAQSPIDALVAGGGTDGFARAEVVREFVFPEDHGPHPDFQTEWWYVTGHLETDSGRRFGLQWTIFRRALSPEMGERGSDWASRQLYMGHMALSDIEGEKHLAEERFTRGAAGLAGAEIRPFRVWLEDWSAERANPEAGDPDSIWPMRLRSSADTDKGAFALDIELDPQKPHVLQGDRGLSWKHEGGASYYYSFTRIDAAGSVELDGERFDVTGSAWLDREWSTSTLSDEQAGWDWFSLQLEDGRDLMYYQLRLKDGDAHPMSAGVLVAPDGTSTKLERADVQLEVLDHWTSPRSQGRYPVRWRLIAPKYDIDLEVEPLFKDQELDIAFRYWEGAVDVRADGQKTGRGFVELVGYADEASESARGVG